MVLKFLVLTVVWCKKAYKSNLCRRCLVVMLLGLVIVRKQSLRAVFEVVFLHWASFDELAGEMNSFSNKLLDSDYFRILYIYIYVYVGQSFHRSSFHRSLFRSAIHIAFVTSLKKLSS